MNPGRKLCHSFFFIISVPLYPYGEAAGDSYLSKELDGCGPVMSSPIDIPIYGIPHKKWTVSVIRL